MIPSGICQCGCGGRTPIAGKTKTSVGAVKGQPTRFIPGHNTRRHLPASTTAQLCGCGCGETTPIATRSDARWGKVKGQPLRFITGHNARLGRTSAGRPTCRCGCGNPVPLVRAAGKPDKPRAYLVGHEPDTGPLFVEAAAELVMAVHDGGPDEFRDQLADALAIETPDGVTAVEALVAALAALVDPDTRPVAAAPVVAYLGALRDTSAGAA